MDQRINYNGNYKNAISHNLWDATKDMLRGKLIALNASINT